MALAKNKRTGKTVSVPDHYIGHPVLGIDLVAAGTEVQAAPKKEMKHHKEQPAPVAKAFNAPEPTINIEEDKE